jgi:translation elongation factor EF-1alpha
VTIDVGVSQFKTKKRSYTLLDAPGHKDFVPNMISGTSQADVAILVIDASPGGFESGFDSKGQTREHALLLKSLGIEQIIVCINKMDMCNWSQERFRFIQSSLEAYLGSIGYGTKSLRFVPVSGYTGENLTQLTKCSWYREKTLVEALGRHD